MAISEPLFPQFPKQRFELPPAYQRIHKAAYADNRHARSPVTSVTNRLESWMHLKVAADAARNPAAETLEIGAGTLNHLKYEPAQNYDIVEPFEELFEQSPDLHRVRSVFGDIRQVPDLPRYDRIVSVATFEHICDLPFVVARAARLLKPDGCLRAGIPSEGTILWKMGYTFTTGIEFRMKYGLKYSLIMNYEHVNTAREIEQVLNGFFRDVRRKVFGVCRALSLYQFYECRNPDLRSSDAYLAQYSRSSR